MTIGLMVFAFYSFREHVSEGKYAIVVVSNSDIYISYGDGKQETIRLKPGRNADNDNATVGVFNKMDLKGYGMLSSNTSRDGSVYYVFRK